jgi:hypothetical protein
MQQKYCGLCVLSKCSRRDINSSSQVASMQLCDTATTLAPRLYKNYVQKPVSHTLALTDESYLTENIVNIHTVLTEDTVTLNV